MLGPASVAGMAVADEAETPRTWHQRRYDQLKAQGKCVSACGADAVPGFTRCACCREKDSTARARRKAANIPDRSPDYYTRRNEKKRQNGICIVCSAPAVRGRTLCPKHRAAANSRSRMKVALRRLTGRCLQCGKEGDFGQHVRCWMCRLGHAHRMAEKRRGDSPPANPIPAGASPAPWATPLAEDPMESTT